LRRFLELLLRRRAGATIAAAALAALVPLFTPLCYLSGAVVSVATLRYGWREGLSVIGGAVALLGGLAYLVVKSLAPALLMAVFVWLPVWALSAVLRISASQGAMLALGGALAVAIVVGYHVFTSGSAEWWRSVLEEVVARAIDELNLAPTQGVLEQLDRVLDLLAPIMTGLLISAVLLMAILTSMLGRYWHAVLDNPGGFGKEFRALRLDRRVGWVVLAAVLIGAFAGRSLAPVAQEVVCVAVVLFLFQGLAVAHGVVAQTKASIGWLIVLYVLLGIVTPQMIVLLALIGFLDTWVNLRGRFGAARAG
jgi:hypothetical protein